MQRELRIREENVFCSHRRATPTQRTRLSVMRFATRLQKPILFLVVLAICGFQLVSADSLMNFKFKNCPEHCLQLSTLEHRHLCCSGRYPSLNVYSLHINTREYEMTRKKFGLYPAKIMSTDFVIRDLVEHGRVCFPVKLRGGNHRGTVLQKVCFPSAIIACCPKSGTGALRDFLGDHPRVQIAKSEARFFSSRSPLSHAAEYLAHLPLLDMHSDDIVVEKTPRYGYVSSGETRGIAAIRKMLPTVKLVFTLRDPAHQMYSWYWHCSSVPNCDPPSVEHYKSLWNSSASTEEEELKRRDFFSLKYSCLGAQPCCPGHVARGFLDQVVGRSITAFQGNITFVDDTILDMMNVSRPDFQFQTNMLAFVNDDVVKDPARVMKAISIFIGVDCVPNCEQSPPFDWEAGFASVRSDSSRRLMTSVAGVKQFHCFEGHCLAPTKGRSYPSLTPRDEYLLSLLYRDSIGKLFDLLNRSYLEQKWPMYTDPKLKKPTAADRKKINGILRECSHNKMGYVVPSELE